MTAQERLEDILKKVNKHGTVSVKELAIEYRVTEDLIRKDLKRLEQLDEIVRNYGGAERKHNKFEVSSIHYRRQIDNQEKINIAKKAVSLIKEGEFIFLDASSTSMHIASVLAETGLEVTVITNMLEIMSILSGVDGVRLIAIGGEYDNYTGSFTGQEALRQIEQYRVDKAFISCRSVSAEDGWLIEGFVGIGNEKKTIFDIAKTHIVATQSIKYKSSGVYKFYPLSKVDYLITEKSLPPEEEAYFKSLGIQLL